MSAHARYVRLYQMMQQRDRELASAFGVHGTQIGQWKRRLVEGATELFSDDRRRESQDQESLVAGLYEQIGRLQMELGWLKKKVARLD